MRASTALLGGIIVVFLVTVLGCSAEVQGNAIAAKQDSIPPRSTSVKFDPCDLPAELLEDLDLPGVGPTELSGTPGCLWANDSFAIGILLIEDTTFIENPYANPEVSDVEMLPYGDYTTYLYVLDDDMYATQTMTEAGAVSMYISEAGNASLADERQSLLERFDVIAPYFPPPR